MSKLWGADQAVCSNSGSQTGIFRLDPDRGSPRVSRHTPRPYGWNAAWNGSLPGEKPGAGFCEGSKMSFGPYGAIEFVHPDFGRKPGDTGVHPVNAGMQL